MKFQPRLFSDPQLNPATEDGWRRRWFDIIYRHDTPPSRNFDLVLVLAILASVIVIMLDSVQSFHARHAGVLYALEWAFTLLFTAEYALRLATVRRPLRYAVSIWGIIDLLSILPTYLSVLVPGAQSLLVVRILRILRLFRILKLTQYVEESGQLVGALWRSRRKIFVFVCAVLTLVDVREHPIEEITPDRVWVSPAPGQPAKLPFWHGDSVGRPIELTVSGTQLSSSPTALTLNG